jgi:DNA-binding winged helix-turn-helix (wHTH) protein/TolB-like protein/Tfp pilus assembly protein PilF
MEGAHSLRFDGFVIDRSRHVLRAGDRDVPLRPQSFDVLCHLAERAGVVVSKDELIAAVWQRRPASDESVTQCIKDVRQALGEGAHDIIKTISKRGYLFAVEVSAVSAGGSPRVPQALSEQARPAPRPVRSFRFASAAAAAAGVLLAILAGAMTISRDRGPTETAPLTLMAAPSVTILPFRQTGEHPQETAALGSLAPDIAAELATIGRNYALDVKAVDGRDVDTGPAALARLGTRYAVLGIVLRSEERFQINVRLVEARSNHLVWGQIFEPAAGGRDAPGLIATRIAHMISLQLLTAESQRPLPALPSAGDYVLLGRARLLGERGALANREAQALFEKALALEPDSAFAMLGVARTSIDDVLNGWVPFAQHAALLDRAEAMNRRFIAQQPRNREGQLQRGVLARARNNIEQAIAAIEHTLELSPRYPQAHAELGRTLIEQGRTTEAIAHIRDAFHLSPTDNAVYIWCLWAGMAAVLAGDYDEALGWLRRSRQANGAYDNTLVWIALAHAGLRETEKARMVLADYRAIRPQFTARRLAYGPPYRNETVAEQRRRVAGLLLGLELGHDEAEAHSSLKH